MVFWDEQPNCAGAAWTGDDNCNSNKDGWIYGGSQTNGFFGAGPNSPETGDYASTHQSVRQAKYTGTVTSKLLLEVSGIHRVERWGNMHLREATGSVTAAQAAILPSMIPVTEQSTNLNYRQWSANYNNTIVPSWTYRVAASYVTGTHNVKMGWQSARGQDRNDQESLGDLEDISDLDENGDHGRRRRGPVLKIEDHLKKLAETDLPGKQLKIESCTAYAANRGIVGLHFPAFYTGDQSAQAQRADAQFGAATSRADP